MGWLASLLLGLPGLAGKLLDLLAKRSDNAALTNGQNASADTAVIQAQLTAYVEERKVIAAERAKLSESLWTAWMVPSLFLLCLYHFGAIVLDSVHHFNWQIAKLPPPYDAFELNVLLTIAGVKAGVTAVRRVFGK